MTERGGKPRRVLLVRLVNMVDSWVPKLFVKEVAREPNKMLLERTAVAAGR